MPPRPQAAEPEPDDAYKRLSDEAERLREQVVTLQADAEKRDEQDATLPEYNDQRAGTGHLEDRLARVTGAMSRIPKRGFNNDQKYQFVAHSDVLDAIRPALAAESVQFRSQVTKTESPAETVVGGAERRTGGGMVWRMWRVEVKFTFSCWLGEKRCEQVTEGWPGYAQDYSDKGASKALTSAIKTFLIQQFLLSTGDDPDEPTREPGDRPAAGAQRPATAPRQAQTSGDVRAARNAALDLNTKMPKGTLSKIAKKLTGQGVILKIEDVAALQKITRAALKYIDNPEGGQAWLDGALQAQSGEPAAEEAERQAAAETGDEPPVTPGQPTKADAEQADDPADGSGADSVPFEPVTLPGPEDEHWQPPLSDEEKRQLALGLNPRPPVDPDDEDIPF